MAEFQLHKYPYTYQCDRCGKKTKLSQGKECSLKGNYDVHSELPLFFVCSKCRKGTQKPIGYSGKESVVMLNLGFWDIVRAIFKH
jgi:hypothetical protein